MTREELGACCEQITEWTKHQSQPIHLMLVHILAHDAEQRAEVARLREALVVALTNLRAWNGEQTWELYRKSHEVQVIEQALKESVKENNI